MQGPLVWITGTYYRRTQADPSSLSRGKWEPAMVLGGTGSGGLGRRGVNRSLWEDCHPAWLVPFFNEGVCLRSFRKKKPYWKTGKTISSPEPLSDTKKCHCFKYFLSSAVSLQSFKAFDNRRSNTKILWFYRINFKRLAFLQAFDFNVLSHIESGVNYGGKQANRSGRSEWRGRENFGSSS